MRPASQEYPESHITRKRWEAYITFQQIDHYLGSYKTKQGAIEARIEGEKKYFDPYISKEKNRKE